MRSPIVRRLAKELGLDPHRIPATGEDGVITRSDVLRAAERGGDARQATPTRPETSGEQSDARGMHGLQVLSSERLSPLRKMVAAKLGRSRAEIPEATVWVDVDFTELWRLRPQMAAEGERPPSVTTLVARFLLLALEQYPLLASRLSEDATELQTFDGVNLGIAVDSERGLSVPVLPRAHELSISELDTALRKVSAEARTGRLEPARLAGSTITFNNYGGFGVDGSAAIINYPEVAIVGMGRVIERPWVVDGEIVARRIAQLSLVFDHRVCDGGYAAGFLRSLVDMIEHPLRVYGRL
jgi:pyruvate dehydrogenase E2 component (dihydrolipoamide acetyltransferase)